MAPTLSIIVIVYNMPRQAMNTLYSFSAAHQWNVSSDQYEVIVIENRSDNNLDAQAVEALGENFHYFIRDEDSVSPAGAINFGFEQARGEFIGLVVDGARMVTPRVIEYTLMGLMMDPEALVITPCHNIGPQEQHFSDSNGYSETVEIELLADVKWQQHGYRLFDCSSVGGANLNGIFHPLMESNCMFVSAKKFKAIGGADMRFQLPGGGALNLHTYCLLGKQPDTRLIVLAGEGSFHQYHGGVTTSEKPEREALLQRQIDQLHSLWDGQYQVLHREPMLLGAITSHALPFISHSSRWATKRFERYVRQHQDPWPDDD